MIFGALGDMTRFLSKSDVEGLNSPIFETGALLRLKCPFG